MRLISYSNGLGKPTIYLGIWNPFPLSRSLEELNWFSLSWIQGRRIGNSELSVKEGSAIIPNAINMSRRGTICSRTSPFFNVNNTRLFQVLVGNRMKFYFVTKIYFGKYLTVTKMSCKCRWLWRRCRLSEHEKRI